MLLGECPRHRHGGAASGARRRSAAASGEAPLAYDYLIVATGASHAYFGHEDWATRAPGLKTLDDALEIRRRVLLAFEAAERETDPALQLRLLTFVIVGGGPTGVELAGALAEIARRTLRQDFRRIRPETAKIVLLEAGPHLLGAFPPRLRAAAQRSLVDLGVEVRTECPVIAIDGHSVTWRMPGGGGEVRLEAQTILWAAGVAASGVGSFAWSADRPGRPHRRRTDPGSARTPINLRGRGPVFVHAGRQPAAGRGPGRQAAGHARREEHRARDRGKPLEPFRYRDYGNMATIGRGSAVADLGPIETSGFLAWLMWLFVHIFWLVGFRNRVAVLGEWAWAYLSFQRRVRLITGGRQWPSS